MATEPCGMCNKPFEEGEKKIELLCNHTFHTECFIHAGIRDNYIPDITCHTCSIPFVPNEVIERNNMFHDEDNIHTVLQFTFETNEDFRNDLKGLQAASRERIAAANQFNTKNIIHMAEFKKETATAVSFLKMKVDEAKKTVIATEDYKNMVKAQKKFLSRVTKFRHKWGTGIYNVRRALNGNDAAKQYLNGIGSYYGRCMAALRGFRIRIK